MDPWDREVAERFKRRLIDAGVPLCELRVFGSRARGDATFESDLDVFLLLESSGEETLRTVSDIAWEVGFASERIITTIEFAVDDSRFPALRASPLWATVHAEGIAI